MSELHRLAARMVCIGFNGPELTADARRLIERGVGAVCLFKRNFAAGQQFADLCAQIKLAAGDRPIANCIDHEGGRVARLGEPFTPIPSMRAVGAVGDITLAREIGNLMARELRAANVDWNFAPVVDVDTNPANPVIGSRSFGRDPTLVTQMAAAIISGLRTNGVAACAKHFPGHGDTAQDSHTDLPRLPHAMDRLEHVELVPFKAMARIAPSIMTAHVVFEAIDATAPATMSRPVLTGLLREKLNFDGVIVSDDLEMKAIAAHYDFDDVILRGAQAGIDLFTIAHSAELQNRAIETLVKSVERGDLTREALERSNHRLDTLFEKYVQGPRSGPLPDVVGCAAHRQLVAWIEESAREHDPTVFIR